MKRRTAIIGALVLIFGGVLTWFVLDKTLTSMRGANVPQATGTVSIGGAFELTNQNGKRVTDKNFAGKYMLVYFGYTFCPDVCPTELQAMSEALDLLGKDADQLTPIFISIDPARDGVKEMKAYVKAFNPRLVGLTGSAQDIAKVAKTYRVYYSKVVEKGKEDDKDYAMDHSAIVYFMDRKGKYAAHFTYGTKPEVMAKKIRDILKKDGA
jgi:protein SCO1/2